MGLVVLVLVVDDDDDERRRRRRRRRRLLRERKVDLWGLTGFVGVDGCVVEGSTRRLLRAEKKGTEENKPTKAVVTGEGACMAATAEQPKDMGGVGFRNRSKEGIQR